MNDYCGILSEHEGEIMLTLNDRESNHHYRLKAYSGVWSDELSKFFDAHIGTGQTVCVTGSLNQFERSIVVWSAKVKE